MNFGAAGFNVLASRRPFYLLKVMKKYKYKNIIYSDIDTIWLKDPRTFLKGKYDFWAQLDGLIDGIPYFEGFIPYICTGFLALQSTKKTLKILRLWRQVTEIINNKSRVNQADFQRIVFEQSANFGVLPLRYFPNGETYFEQMSELLRKDVVFIHNNYIIGKAKKIQRFQQFDIWAQDFMQGKYISLSL